MIVFLCAVIMFATFAYVYRRMCKTNIPGIFLCAVITREHP